MHSVVKKLSEPSVFALRLARGLELVETARDIAYPQLFVGRSAAQCTRHSVVNFYEMAVMYVVKIVTLQKIIKRFDKIKNARFKPVLALD